MQFTEVIRKETTPSVMVWVQDYHPLAPARYERWSHKRWHTLYCDFSSLDTCDYARHFLSIRIGAPPPDAERG